MDSTRLPTLRTAPSRLKQRIARSGVGLALALLVLVVASFLNIGRHVRRATLEWFAVPRQQWWYPFTNYIPIGHHLTPASFRAGGSLTVLITSEPHALIPFRSDWPTEPEFGMWTDASCPVQYHNCASEIDVIGITADDWTLYLSADGVVHRDDRRMMRKMPIVQLTPSDAIMSGCTFDFLSVAFISANHPDSVVVESLTAPFVTHALPVDPAHRTADWATYRFGGSLGGPCVLWSPGAEQMLIVTDSAVRPLGGSSSTISQRNPVWRMVRSANPFGDKAYYADVTSVPGGIAVLPMANAGRVVDYYNERGDYITSVRLSRTATRIAGAPGRIFGLSQFGSDGVGVSSYALPAEVAALAAAAGMQHR